jgi:hypothetical protein
MEEPKHLPSSVPAPTLAPSPASASRVLTKNGYNGCHVSAPRPRPPMPIEASSVPSDLNMERFPSPTLFHKKTPRFSHKVL